MKKEKTPVEQLLHNILIRRVKLNYYQDYMAYQLNICKQTYRYLESGKRPLSTERLYTIAEVLMTTPAELITGNPWVKP